MDLNIETLLQNVQLSDIDNTDCDTEDYLQTLHRFLLEDFQRPLRRDVKKLLHGSWNFDNLINHGTVKVLSCTVEQDVVYTLQMESVAARRKLSQTTSRLPVGCLVLLVGSGGTTIVFGVICHRNTLELESGIVGVEVLNQGTSVQSETRWELLEYTIYYEAYKHSLFNLRTFKNVPLAKQLVNYCQEHNEQNFFKDNRISLESPQRKCSNLSDVSAVYTELNKKREEQNSKDLINIKDEAAWSARCYDESQKKAIIQSLTSKVSVIQGPPGRCQRNIAEHNTLLVEGKCLLVLSH